MEKYLVGIDIGGTTVKLGLFDIEGELLHNWEIETRKIENGKYILGDIANSIDQLLKEKNINKENVEQILRDEVGKKFSTVLEHAGVFKRDEEGINAFNKFINSL